MMQCYDENVQVGRGYFLSAAKVIRSRDINYSMPLILNVCLLKIADENPQVRKTALAVLARITASDKYSISPTTGVHDTSQALQARVSSLKFH